MRERGRDVWLSSSLTMSSWPANPADLVCRVWHVCISPPAPGGTGRWYLEGRSLGGEGDAGEPADEVGLCYDWSKHKRCARTDGEGGVAAM
jgi:hypothetical protein